MKLTPENIIKNSEHDCVPTIILYKTQWHTIYNWMQEYSDQNTKHLIDEIAELKAKYELKNDECNNYAESANKYHDLCQVKNAEIAKLKASKSEANEAVELYSELEAAFIYSRNYPETNIKRFREIIAENYPKKQIFKTRNNK